MNRAYTQCRCLSISFVAGSYEKRFGITYVDFTT